MKPASELRFLLAFNFPTLLEDRMLSKYSKLFHIVVIPHGKFASAFSLANEWGVPYLFESYEQAFHFMLDARRNGHEMLEAGDFFAVSRCSIYLNSDFNQHPVPSADEPVEFSD